MSGIDKSKIRLELDDVIANIPVIKHSAGLSLLLNPRMFGDIKKTAIATMKERYPSEDLDEKVVSKFARKAIKKATGSTAYFLEYLYPNSFFHALLRDGRLIRSRIVSEKEKVSAEHALMRKLNKSPDKTGERLTILIADAKKGIRTGLSYEERMKVFAKRAGIDHSPSHNGGKVLINAKQDKAPVFESKSKQAPQIFIKKRRSISIETQDALPGVAQSLSTPRP